jgi:intracellular septation protein
MDERRECWRHLSGWHYLRTMSTQVEAVPPKAMSPLFKLILDLGPLVVFFATYKFFNIFAATGALMVVTIVTLAIGYVLTKKISIIPLVTGVMVIIFGGLTLWLESDWFIKVKLTIIYTLLATGMYVGLYFGRPFAKVMLDAAFELPEHCWRTLTYRTAALFLVIAGINEVAWRLLTTDDWVTFKVIGVPVIMFAFFMANAPFIMRNEIKRDE